VSNGWLEIQNLEKNFDGIRALANFSCSLRQDEILGLIGPNGAGKTTLFNVISGFFAPDSGKASFQGTNLLGLPPHKIATTGITRTFQNLRLIRQLSVLDNVLLSFRAQPGERLGNVFFRRKHCKEQESANRKEALSLLEDAGIAEKMNNPCGPLWSGRKAPASCRNPSLVL